jgi:NADH-quinone oxidoreductase subunit C
MSVEALNALKQQFPAAVERTTADHPALTVPIADLTAALHTLRDQWAFDLLMDVTAIDWSESASPRFTVVYHLLSTDWPPTASMTSSRAPRA